MIVAATLGSIDLFKYAYYQKFGTVLYSLRIQKECARMRRTRGRVRQAKLARFQQHHGNQRSLRGQEIGMSKIYSLEDLRSWSPEKRKAVYVNALKHPSGQYIVDLIVQNGLALSSGGLRTDDPVYRRIVDLAWSIQGQKAAVAATKQGVPALCGVDVLLQADLGNLYGKYDLGTASAGAIVAEVMRHLGYKEAGQGSCPQNCTAKTGMKWR